MQRTHKIEKVVAKAKLGEQKSDFADWQSQPPIARLEVLEQIRQEYHRWKYGEGPRMQKTVTIIRMKT
jgi:hypothetical protein